MQSVILFISLAIVFHQAIVIQSQTKDIVETAIENGAFKTLVAALTAADLVTALKGTGPFTVFAPTDTAFDKLPAGTVADLLKPENKEKLARILKYHVINGKSLTSAQIIALPLPAKVEMMQGDTVSVTQVGADIKVNDATVIIPNVMATNGIIHAIDTVLMPPAASSATNFFLNQPLLFVLLCTVILSSLRFL